MLRPRLSFFSAILGIALFTYSCETRKISLREDVIGNVIVFDSDKVKYYLPRNKTIDYLKKRIESDKYNQVLESLYTYIIENNKSALYVKDSLIVFRDTLQPQSIHDSVLTMPDWSQNQTRVISGIRECLRHFVVSGDIGIWDKRSKKFVLYVYYKKEVSNVATDVKVSLPDGTEIMHYLEEIR